MKLIHLYMLALMSLVGCKQGGPYHSKMNEQIFKPAEQLGVITDTDMREASGLEASHINPGMYWTHNDSGNDSKLYLIDAKGILKMSVHLKGIKNRDWEDLTLTKSGDGAYIYIGDIGDNIGKRKKLHIFKISEPKYDGSKEIEIPKKDIETMTFTYENGARDAETLLSGKGENDLIIVTKRDTDCLVYPFKFTVTDEVVEIKSIGTVPLSGLTGGDANEAGEILIKSYDEIFYWLPSDAPVAERITEGPDYRIPYEAEPQGEAICWDGEKNFLTLSEFHQWARQYIYFYERAE